MSATYPIPADHGRLMRLRRLTCTALVLLATLLVPVASAIQAQTQAPATLVKDINTTPDPLVGSSPGDFVAIDGKAMAPRRALASSRTCIQAQKDRIRTL